VTESERDVPGAPEGRSGAKRAALGAARPLVGYFDKRFQDLHDHLDRQRLPTDLDARLDQVVALSRQTREEVAADADTIAELAFTLERFADLFTARMEEIVEQTFSLGAGGTGVDSQVVELPFAYAVADTLPRSARVASLVADGAALSLALASLGMRVVALDAAGMPTGHPNITVLDDPVERWSGPSEPLHAIFALSSVASLGLGRDHPVDDADRQVVDLFRKWLQPDGVLVLTVPYGEWSVGRHTRTYDDRRLASLLADWEIDDQRVMERVDDHVWRRVDPGEPASSSGMALVRATPRS
jgi:hypothetical protein